MKLMQKSLRSAENLDVAALYDVFMIRSLKRRHHEWD